MAKTTKAHISHTIPRDKGRFSKIAQPQPIRTEATVPTPNAGKPVIPHVATFQSFVQTISDHRTYWPSDEAVRQSRIEADKMLFDTVIKGCLDERFRATALANWHLEPEDKRNQNQVEMCDKLTRIVTAIPNFTEYRLWLLNAVYYGRVAIDNIYGWHQAGAERWIGIKDWLPIHGDKLVFDDDRRVGVKVGTMLPPWMSDGVVQTNQGRVYYFDEYLRSKITLHKGEIRDGLYEDYRTGGYINGVGIRNWIYWAYWIKQQALTWALNAIERYGAGFTVWFFTEGNPESEAQVRAAAEAQSGQNSILFPRPLGMDQQGPGMEFREMNGRGLEHIKSFLTDYFDGQIERFIIGQGLSSKAAGTGLGSGVADFQKQTKSDIVKLDAVKLSETLTRELVWKLAAANFPGQPCPIRFVIDIDDTERKELLEASKQFFEMGGALDEDQLRSELGLSKPGNGAAVLSKGSLTGGVGDAVDPASVDPKQLTKGIKDEGEEHTEDPKQAEEVAIDHLAKNPTYYTELEKLAL